MGDGGGFLAHDVCVRERSFGPNALIHVCFYSDIHMLLRLAILLRADSARAFISRFQLEHVRKSKRLSKHVAG